MSRTFDQFAGEMNDAIAKLNELAKEAREVGYVVGFEIVTPPFYAAPVGGGKARPLTSIAMSLGADLEGG